MRKWAGVWVLAGALAVGGCATTKVTSSWTDPYLKPQEKAEKTLVVASVPDASTRRNLEDELTMKLRQEGVNATPSWRYIPDGKINKDNIRQVASQQGMDSVLVTRFQGVQHKLYYEPGYTWDGYWGMWDPWMYQPGYIREQTVARLESSLFSPQNGGTLVWTASTQTLNPSGSWKQIASIADKIVDRMHEDAVI